MRLGVNTGRALMSIGDDVLATGRDVRSAQLQERLAQMREERERELLELKAQLGGVRGVGGVGGLGGAGGARGGLVAGALSDEQLSALSGQTVPEFQEGREFNRTGRLPQRPAFTVDDEGNPFVDAEGKPMAPMTDDFEARPRLERNAGRAREGIVRSTIAPQYLDQFEKGRTEATARDGAFSGDPVRVEQTRLAVRAKDGKDRFKVDGDEKIDESSADGFQGQTEQGKAKGKAADALVRQRNAEAAKDDRTDPNRTGGRGGSGAGGMSDAQLTAAIEAQRKVVSDLNKDFSRGAKERKPQEVARLNALQAEQDRRMGIKVGGAPAPAPAAPAPAGARPPLSSFLR